MTPYVVLVALCVSSFFVDAGRNNYVLRKTCSLGTYGSDYIGCTSQTSSGITCQRWDSQTPHSHGFSNPKNFPDGTMDDVANKCRNPDHDGEAWCYTTDPGKRFQFCGIPRCSEYPECRRTAAGAEYRGHVKRANPGCDCMPWDSLSTAQLSLLNAQGVSLQDTDSNYCRNPDPSSRPDGVWCFTGEDVDEWDYCDVPRCKPSAQCRRTTSGEEYSGTVSMTKSGRPCQRWDHQFPHQHPYLDDSFFPERSLEEASNYCRNPSADDKGPWCYTIDPDVPTDSCDIPVCQNCKVTQDGREYSGNISVTSSFQECQRWDKESENENSDPNLFPDATVSDAANFCRNPDGKSGGPWCYTNKAADRWEYCDVPLCSGDGQQRPRNIKHVLQIGIDGLHPCFVNAPGGGANIMNRLAARGAYTLTKGRTVLASVSGPAWSSFITGMPTESTGVTGNSWRPPSRGWSQSITPITGTEYPLPNVFRTLKAQDDSIHTSAYYDWNWWGYILNTGDPGSVDNEMYCNPSANGGIPACDAYLLYNVSQYIQQVYHSADRTYTLLYMDQVDEAGHNHNWCSERYLDAVDQVDGLVGDVLDVLDEAGLADEFLIILSSDHGGFGDSHGQWIDDSLQIPLFIRGPGVKVGYEFQHEVRNQDLVPTAIWAMGFEKSPWQRGDIIKEAFEGY